jgi:hypothetical protein
MIGWLTIIRTIGGYIASVAASVFMAWLGFSQLYRWYTTGELLASFRGMDNLTKRQLITYENHPFNFVSLFAIYVMVAAVGLAACAGLYLRIRKWRGNKPKTDN